MQRLNSRIVAILITGTLPLYAQAQQPNAAELAQKVVGVIAGNKTKTQTYCQVLDLSDELDQVDQKKEGEKAEDLSQKINELQKNLGPEYLALLEALKNVDPNSKDGQEIVSIFDKLDSSCEDQQWCTSSRLTCRALCPRSSHMGFNRRKLEDQRREAAEKEAASRRATDAQVLEDAERLIAAWNERQAKQMPMLFSPTIGAVARHCGVNGGGGADVVTLIQSESVKPNVSS